MKNKNILLSIVLALSLPTNSEAITSYTANALATISGSLGAALFGASLMKSERGSNTEVLMAAAGFGCFTGKLTHLWLHGFTPEARLEKAQTINREVNGDPFTKLLDLANDS